jgi:hypothetical protein
MLSQHIASKGIFRAGIVFYGAAANNADNKNNKEFLTLKLLNSLQ